jgi:rhodanese-related sulfurtransferase
LAKKTSYRSPEHVEGAVTTSAQQAKQLFDEGVTFVDVRNIKLHTRKHIPGAHHLDLKKAFNETSLSKLVNKDQPFVIYCSGVKCSRSYHAASRAISWSFTRVHYFRGGIVAWKKAGYPLKYAEKNQQNKS